MDTSEIVSSPQQAYDVLEKKRKTGKAVDAKFFQLNPQDSKKGLSRALKEDRQRATSLTRDRAKR